MKKICFLKFGDKTSNGDKIDLLCERKMRHMMKQVCSTVGLKVRSCFYCIFLDRISKKIKPLEACANVCKN